MSSYKLLIHSAQQIVQVSANGEMVLKGDGQKHVAIMEMNGSDGLSLVIGRDSRIKAIGFDSQIKIQFDGASFDEVIDASGRCVTPGFVDCHTHPVWAGDRVHEFAMTLAGKKYLEILEAGGGINFTVSATQKASIADLTSSLEERVKRMIKAGTTLAEAKSGYALGAEGEARLLRILADVGQRLPIDLSLTHCGAHSIPSWLTCKTAAADAVIEKHLPMVEELRREGIMVDSVDVFCEKGVFELEETRKILEAGKRLGLRLNFHAEELNHMGSAELGAELGAHAISHLEYISDEGIQAMARSGSVAILLPTTAFQLRLKSPPARALIDAGVPVALGSDFNPNSFCIGMATVMYMACVMMGMSLPEALAASTINAAYSIGRSATHGSLEVGKVGDILILNAPNWEHVVYQLGGQDHVIETVIKNGEVVHSGFGPKLI